MSKNNYYKNLVMIAALTLVAGIITLLLSNFSFYFNYYGPLVLFISYILLVAFSFLYFRRSFTGLLDNYRSSVRKIVRMVEAGEKIPSEEQVGELKGLAEVLNERQNCLDRLEAVNNQLKDKLKKRLDRNSEEISEAIAGLEKTKTRVRELEEKILSYVRGFNQIGTEVAEFSAILKQLGSDIKQEKRILTLETEHHSEFEHTNEKIREVLDSLLEITQDLLEQINERLNNKIGSVGKKVASLKELENNLRLEIGRLDEEPEGLKLVAEEIREELDRIRTGVGELEKLILSSVDKIEDKLAETKKARENFRELQGKDSQKQLDKLSKLIRTNLEILVDLEEDCEKIQGIQTELTKNKVAFTEDFCWLADSVEELGKHLRALEETS